MKDKGLILAILALIFGTVISCNAQTTKENQQTESVSADQIEVYYFHLERRCATCMAVEEESEKALQELYPEKVKSGEVSFLSINLEDESNEALAKKLNVSGQTLLIVKGEKQDNLTNTAFMNARSNPDKLKKAIQKSIDNI
jgi:hypothetical protein